MAATIKLGGVERSLAPVTFRILRRVGENSELLAVLAAGKVEAREKTHEAYNLVRDVILNALREHKDITADSLEDLLDQWNMGDVFVAVMKNSGAKPRADPGEAMGP